MCVIYHNFSMNQLSSVNHISVKVRQGLENRNDGFHSFGGVGGVFTKHSFSVFQNLQKSKNLRGGWKSI